jgi:site-specific DNA-methyltransferase (adenine-specific)
MLKIKDNVDLRCGDCLEIMKTIPDKSIDMILCDLPYGTTVCKWDIVIPFEPLWEQYNRVIKNNGAIVLFGSEPFSSQLRMSNIKNYKYDWKWNKCTHSNPLLAKKQPLRIYEDIMIFYEKQATYNPQMVKGNPYKKDYGYKEHKNSATEVRMIDKDNETGDRYPTNIIKFPLSRNNRTRLHPTQKPVELLEYLIKTYTNEGETVLDNCMGSGSTGVACINTNRNFIGIELDENYYKIACERINNIIKVDLVEKVN